MLINVSANGQQATQEPPLDVPIDSRVLIVGDSISAAYGMSLEQGWAALLARQLQEIAPQSEVINASISGDTSAGGLRRLPSLLQEHKPALVVLELGGNDGLRGYPTASLESNLREMAMLAMQASAEVLILPMEIPPNYGARYTSGFRSSFTTAAQQSGATLGPFVLQDIATQAELMQDDGIHPKQEAQAIIVDLLLPVIAALLDVSAS